MNSSARERRSEEILNAARELFCERGYDGTAMVDIATAIGVVEGTVYKYFDSKRGLLLSVLEHWYAQMFGDYARDLAGVSGARARLRLLIWRHLRSVQEHPALCRLMFREFRGDSAYPNSHVYALNRRYTDFLVDVLRDGAASGEFRADLPLNLLRDLVYGGIEHHAWAYLCGHGALDIDSIAEQLTGVLCDGVGRPDPNDLGRETRRLARIAKRLEERLPANPAAT